MASKLSSTSLVERGISIVKDSIYESVYLIAKDTATKSWWFVLVSLVECLQLLAFSFQLLASTAQGDDSTLKPLLDKFLIWPGLTGNAFCLMSDGVGLAIYFSAMSWIFLFCGFTLIAGYWASVNPSQTLSSIRYLRTIAQLSSTILFVPILSVLFQAFRCDLDGNWVPVSSMECYTGAHIGFVVLSSLLLPIYSVLCVFITAVVFDRNIRSTELTAKVHGRTDILLMVCKIPLVMIFALLWESVERVLLALLLLASAIVTMVCYVIYQPHVRFEVNSCKSALAGTYMFATIISLVMLMDADVSFSVVLLLGIPLAALVSYMASNVRQTVISRRDLEDLRSYHDISIWARKRAELYEQAKKNQDQMELRHEVDSSVDFVTNHDASLKSAEFSSREIRLEAAKEKVEQAYRVCIDKFPHNGNAILEASSFFRNYRANLFMEMTTFNLAKRNANALDVQFAIFQRLRELRESSHSNNDRKTLSALDRLHFDHEFSKASNLETKCYRIIYQFWETLNKKIPDVAELQYLAEGLHKVAEEAVVHYENCLKLNPESIVALRSFGAFLLKVKVDNEGSSQYLAKADRIEDQMGRQKQKHLRKLCFYGKLNNIGGSGDRSGVIIISGDRMGIGQILDVNTEASKIFGRSKDELLGSNINLIIPKPFSIVHDSYLRKFAQSGNSNFINTNRSLLGIHGSGALIPLVLNVKEIPPEINDETAAPRLSAVIRSPKTDEHFMLFECKSKGYKLIHADSASLSRVIGMTAQQLAEREVSAAEYLGELRSFGITPDSGDESDTATEVSMNRMSNVKSLKIRTPVKSCRDLRMLADGRTTCKSLCSEDGFGLDGDQFLQSLEESEDYTKIIFENVADEEVQNVEGRVQSIDVREYGTVFLLAWRTPTRRKRTVKDKSKNEANKEFTVSAVSCPYAPSHKISESDSDSHPFSVPNTPLKRWPLDSIVPTRSIAACDNIPSAAPQKMEKIPTDLTDEMTLYDSTHMNLNPDGDINTAELNTLETPRRGSGATTGTFSATHAIQGAIGNSSHLVNPTIMKLHSIVLVMMVSFVIVSATVPAVINHHYSGFQRHVQSVRTATSEMVHFSQALHILSKVHIAGSRFSDLVEDQAPLWSSFQEGVEAYAKHMRSSRSSVVSVGGSPRHFERENYFEIMDEQISESETLSADQIRDFMNSHLNLLIDEADPTELSPGNTVRSALLSFSNEETYSMAINESTKERMEYLRDTTSNLVEELTISLVCLSVFGVIFAFGVTVYLLQTLSTLRRSTLATFLYISRRLAKKMSTTAAQSLKEHVEMVTKVDLGEGDESDVDTVSIGSEYENESVDNTFGKQVLIEDGSQKKPFPEDGSQFLKFQSGVEDRGAVLSSGVNEVREHVNTSKFMMKSLGKVALPLIPFVIWVVFFIVDAAFIVRDLRTEVDRGYEINQLTLELIEYQQTVHNLALRVHRPDSLHGSASLDTRKVYQRTLTMLQQSILHRLSIVLYGGKSVNGDNISGYDGSRIERQMFENDACFVLEGDLANRCRRTALTGGLRNFIQEFLNDGADIVSDLPSIHMDNEPALDDLADGHLLLKRIRNLDNIGLVVEIGAELGQFATQASVENMDDSVSHQTITTIVCCLMFVFTTVAFSLPSISSIGNSLRASFETLLLLPDDVVTQNWRVRQQLKTLR